MVSEQTKSTADSIKNYIKQNGIEYRTLFDLLDVAKTAFEKENDTEWALKVTSYIKECCTWAIQNSIEVLQMDELYWKTLKVEAPYWFDSYLIYLERKRERRDMFYLPKRKQLNKHRVEWRAVGGNPACRGYDNFISRHNGTKHILRDAIRDADGNYRDDIIYEIVRGGGVDA